jgi:hypothetical protein
MVQFAYVDKQGRVIRHGPLVERGVRGNCIVVSRTGFYLEDEPQGVFAEYQTYWGTKSKETLYDHGKEIKVMTYPVPYLRPNSGNH